MPKIIQQISLFVLLLIFAACTNTRIPQNQFYVFTGHSEWTENEKEACVKAIENTENADSVKVIFKKTNIPSMGQAQPLIRTILKKPDKRTYIVKVQDCNSKNLLCYSVLPDSAKVGLIGHELVHVLDYKSKGFFSILQMAIKYSLSRKYRSRVEYVTDSLTIVHNMGNEVLLLLDFVENSGLASKSYLRKKKKYYMDSDEVLRIIHSQN